MRRFGFGRRLQLRLQLRLEVKPKQTQKTVDTHPDTRYNNRTTTKGDQMTNITKAAAATLLTLIVGCTSPNSESTFPPVQTNTGNDTQTDLYEEEATLPPSDDTMTDVFREQLSINTSLNVDVYTDSELEYIAETVCEIAYASPTQSMFLDAMLSIQDDVPISTSDLGVVVGVALVGWCPNQAVRLGIL